ncbi:hypothetical protein GQ53DRAFT_828650 [Thozetella sp. PMI_491]|nr:hypothetical protein GQ53DRAFT_828650 [Thozetella sp. PMI_491]
MQLSVLAAIAAFGSFTMAWPTFGSSERSLETRAEVAGCDECSLTGRNALQCWCQTRHNGNTAKTTRSLDKCLGNNNGTVRMQDNGNFSRTCGDIYLESDSTLQALCMTSARSQNKRSPIDLNSVISNDNGYLRCFDHVGCCVKGTCSYDIGCS